MQTDVFWKIHTKSQGTLYATYSVSELNSLTRGDTTSWEFHFPNPNEDLVVESGETYTVESGTTEIYAHVDVKENGTLNVEENGTLIATGGDNLPQLQQYADHAGSYSILEGINNTQNYSEFLPNDADVNSIVLGIEPSQNLKDNNVTGIWGIVDSGTDSRPLALSDYRYEIELTILDEYSAFTDHADIESTLQI